MDKQKTLKILQRKASLPAASDLPTLIYGIDFPQVEGDAKFNKFYSNICNKCERFCQKRLLEWCQKKPMEESHRVFSYRIRHKIIVDKEILTVIFTVILSDKTAGKLLSSCKETHVWKKHGRHYFLCKNSKLS